MIKYTKGTYKVKKEGNFYRVYQGRKKIGRFLLLTDAVDYVKKM